MTRATQFLFVFAVAIAFVSATKVYDCVTGNPMEDTQSVHITNCELPPCRLRKRTKIGILQKFTPAEDIESLTTSVHATIVGVPLPFVGVDGTDACPKVLKASDGTLAGCPLKQGVEYIYNNSFPVLQIYPTVDLKVYWALRQDQKIITCFEVPAKIIN